MIKVTLLIDNKTAYSMTPMEFIVKHILKDVEVSNKDLTVSLTPYGTVMIKEIEQIW